MYYIEVQLKWTLVALNMHHLCVWMFNSCIQFEFEVYYSFFFLLILVLNPTLELNPNCQHTPPDFFEIVLPKTMNLITMALFSNYAFGAVACTTLLFAALRADHCRTPLLAPLRGVQGFRCAQRRTPLPK